MLQTIYSLAHNGTESHIVEVSAALHRGIPSFHIVGLGDTAVQESKERLRSAFKQSHFQLPRSKIAVSLAPADVPKSGPCFDLPIALAIMATDGIISRFPDKTLCIGELNLNGELRAIKGVLPMVRFAKQQGFTDIILPYDNVSEARLIDGVHIRPAHNLQSVVQHILGKKLLDIAEHQLPEPEVKDISEFDFCYIRGQTPAKRVLEIVASGGHNVLLNGPPGSGKTLLARTLATILPPLVVEECLEISELYSIAGLLNVDRPIITTRPFRSPHHTASHVSLVGGGRIPKPGEISLAHLGILFLDEFPEFSTQSIESLRQPLEDRIVTVARIGGTFTFPASFTLIAAMNPCPCGFASDPTHDCTCTQMQIQRYQKRISGPVLDRFDLFLEIPKVPVEDLETFALGEKSSSIAARVARAKEHQRIRFQNVDFKTNSEIPLSQIENYCPLTDEAKMLLRRACDVFHISARSYFRMIRTARTIADMEDQDVIQKDHIEEILQYRRPDALAS